MSRCAAGRVHFSYCAVLLALFCIVQVRGINQIWPCCLQLYQCCPQQYQCCPQMYQCCPQLNSGYQQLSPCYGFQKVCSSGGFYPRLSSYIFIEPWPKYSLCELQCCYPKYQQGVSAIDNALWTSASRLDPMNTVCPLKTDYFLNNCLPSEAIKNQPLDTVLYKYELYPRKRFMKKKLSAASQKLFAPYQPEFMSENYTVRDRRLWPYYTCNCDTNNYNSIPLSWPYSCNKYPESVIYSDPCNYSSYLPCKGIRYLLNSNNKVANKAASRKCRPSVDCSRL